MGNIVGPPFLAALEKAFGGNESVAAQGVNHYPANDEYCTGGSVNGSKDLAEVSLLYIQSELISFVEGGHADIVCSSSPSPSSVAQRPSSP